jgi:hypothetical protein
MPVRLSGEGRLGEGKARGSGGGKWEVEQGQAFSSVLLPPHTILNSVIISLVGGGGGGGGL